MEQGVPVCVPLNPFGVFLLFLGFPGESGFHGFGRLDSSSTDQLRGEFGVAHSEGIVRFFVQLGPIATPCSETSVSNIVETRRMFVNRSLENNGLLMRGLQLYNNGSLHTENISYKIRCCQFHFVNVVHLKEKERVIPPHAQKAGVS